MFAKGCVEHGALPVLAQARYKARFLFGREIEEYFEELWKAAVDMNSLRRRLYGPDALPVGPDRTAVCEQESKMLKLMMKEMERSTSRFDKYLGFR